MFFKNKKNKDINKLKDRIQNLELVISEFIDSKSPQNIPKYYFRYPINPIKVEHVCDEELQVMSVVKYLVTVVVPMSEPSTKQVFRMTRKELDDFMVALPSIGGAYITDLRGEDL